MNSWVVRLYQPQRLRFEEATVAVQKRITGGPALFSRPASGSRFHLGHRYPVLAPLSTIADEGNEISWARFDDNYDSNPKIFAAGLHGKSLHESSIRWCCRHQTNGRIPKEALPLVATLAQLPANKVGRQAAADRLVELNLWEDAGNVWLVHDFAEFGPPRRFLDHDRRGKNHAPRDPVPVPVPDPLEDFSKEVTSGGEDAA